MNAPQTETTARLMPYRLAQRSGVAIDWQAEGYHLLARLDADPLILQELRRSHGPPAAIEWLDSEAYTGRLGRLYDAQRETNNRLIEGLAEHVDLDGLMQELPHTEDLMDAESEAPVIRLINGIFSEALRLSASDIHVEPFERELIVRLRVDGAMREILSPPRVLAPMLISRIKVMAGLDIAEKRQPQDGRITVRAAGRPVDIRVSTLPGIHGERVVMRLLDKQRPIVARWHRHAARDPRRLSPRPGAAQWHPAQHRSHRLGQDHHPLRQPDRTQRSPAQHSHRRGSGGVRPARHWPDAGQPACRRHLRPRAARHFAPGSRCHHDRRNPRPGNRRDRCAIEPDGPPRALDAAHQQCLGAIARLRDMGIEPFLLATSLKGVMAQRLVRRLCPDCRRWRSPTDAECRQFQGLETLARLAEPGGCDACDQTGYRGRLGSTSSSPSTTPWPP